MATWPDGRVLVLLASGSKQASPTSYGRDKLASGAATGNKSTSQVKETRKGERTTLPKSPPSGSNLTGVYCKQMGHIVQLCYVEGHGGYV